jgi:hypothetical protein
MKLYFNKEELEKIIDNRSLSEVIFLYPQSISIIEILNLNIGLKEKFFFIQNNCELSFNQKFWIALKLTKIIYPIFKFCFSDERPIVILSNIEKYIKSTSNDKDKFIDTFANDLELFKKEYRFLMNDDSSDSINSDYYKRCARFESFRSLNNLFQAFSKKEKNHLGTSISSSIRASEFFSEMKKHSIIEACHTARAFSESKDTSKFFGENEMDLEYIKWEASEKFNNIYNVAITNIKMDTYQEQMDFFLKSYFSLHVSRR